MKTIRLFFVTILLLTSTLSFAQNRVNFKINSAHTEYFVPGSDKDYYVFEYPGLSQHELFNRVKMAWYETSFTTGAFTNIEEVSDCFLQGRVDVVMEDGYYIRYGLIFKFKDEKIRVNTPILMYYSGSDLNNVPLLKMLEINKILIKILNPSEVVNNW